jgi:hypothetical protein
MKKYQNDGWSQTALFATFALLVRGNEIKVVDIMQGRTVVEPFAVPVQQEKCPTCKEIANLRSNDGEFYHCNYCGCDFAKTTVVEIDGNSRLVPDS